MRPTARRDIPSPEKPITVGRHPAISSRCSTPHGQPLHGVIEKTPLACRLRVLFLKLPAVQRARSSRLEIRHGDVAAGRQIDD